MLRLLKSSRVFFYQRLKIKRLRFKEFFSKKADNNQILQEAVLLFLDYETTLAYNKAPLSDSVYKKLNKKLSKEWEDIKIRYEME